jgi:hypothetical protein
VGTIRYIYDFDGKSHSLDDHEGFVEFHLGRPITQQIAEDSPFAPITVGPGWASVWFAGVDEARDRVRAACGCGWRAPEFAWDAACDEETGERRDEILRSWADHLEQEVIAGLEWKRCVECRQYFAVDKAGRQPDYCDEYCRHVGSPRR